MSDGFNFDDFLRNLDPKEAEEMRKDGLNDAMAMSMEDVAPRIWAILLREMQRDKASNAHQLAVLNSALFSVLAWAAMVVPRSDENDDTLSELVSSNVKIAMRECRDPAKIQNMIQVAMLHGSQKLLEDASTSLGHQLKVNTDILRQVLERLK